ncbi:hypothetical protein [Streptomyces sp. NPDC058665]|uniref:hypothetical protein n=1 Tax=Streptomyces sp. NPDC058665 TaxID=3346586 RepID=UPI003645FD21
MSEEQSKGSGQDQYGPVEDLYLSILLDFLNSEGGKGSAMTVSLMMGGTLVCGELVGHDRWLDELNALLRGAGGSAELLGKLFRAVDEKSEPLGEGEPFNFIHLRDVLVLTNYRGTLNGDAAQGLRHPLWRGRLSDVQGWTVGRPA